MPRLYVRARGKGSSVNMPIESKHKYINGQGTIPVFPFVGTGSSSVLRHGRSPTNLYIFNNIYEMAQGLLSTGQTSNLKLYLKSCLISMNISFVPSYLFTFYDKSIWGDPAFIKFRVLTVQFDEAKTETDILSWFRQSFVYDYTFVSEEVLSCHEKTLRETTRWTNQFKILFDKCFTLNSLSNPVVHVQTELKFNKNISYNTTSGTSSPTSDDLFIYTLILGPGNYSTDINAECSAKLAQTEGSDPIAALQISGFSKLTYYDL